MSLGDILGLTKGEGNVIDYGTISRYYGGPQVRNIHAVPLPMLCMEDLNSPAGKATLEELADIWRVRWGHDWVKRGEIEDQFYNTAATRLFNDHRLEAHELADGTRVYRLKE